MKTIDDIWQKSETKMKKDGLPKSVIDECKRDFYDAHERSVRDRQSYTLSSIQTTLREIKLELSLFKTAGIKINNHSLKVQPDHDLLYGLENRLSLILVLLSIQTILIAILLYNILLQHS